MIKKIKKKFLLIGIFLMLILSFLSCKVKQSNKAEAKHKKNTDSVLVSSLAVDDFYQDLYFRYDNFIYKPNIRSMLLYRTGFETSYPFIDLGSENTLTLSFDDLDAGYKLYSYTIIHCDANWKPSDIQQNDYMPNFTEDFITKYSYSINTDQPYTHYSINFPNENIKLSRSGNYLIKVYQNNDKEDVLLTARFMIVETKIDIDVRIKQATNINDRNSKHEVDVTLKQSMIKIPNPYSEIKVVALQNGRWDNAFYLTKPLYIREDLLIYDYEDINLFNAGNEFRYFDTRTLRNYTERVSRINVDSAGKNVSLYTDVRRAGKTYSIYEDLNGAYKILNRDVIGDPSNTADYVKVKFNLAAKKPYSDGSIYIFGALTNWSCLPEAKMKYNYSSGQYEGLLYLKQGYYNYEYLFYSNNKAVGNEAIIEGSYYETHNEYLIFVYYREAGSFYDRIIGLKMVGS